MIIYFDPDAVVNSISGYQYFFLNLLRILFYYTCILIKKFQFQFVLKKSLHIYIYTYVVVVLCSESYQHHQFFDFEEQYKNRNRIT